MDKIILAIVLLGGCFLMHFWMMRRSDHAGHGDSASGNSAKNKDNHSGHSCH